MAARKVLIIGSDGAGKSSLFNRFVYGPIRERRPPAIGLKVGKKEIVADGQPLALILWEITGEISKGRVPRTYLLGASAAVYIFDLSRPGSRTNMESDLAIIRRALPGCLIRIVGNKKDLLNREKLQIPGSTIQADWHISAKTGENVENLFQEVGRELVRLSWE